MTQAQKIREEKATIILNNVRDIAVKIKTDNDFNRTMDYKEVLEEIKKKQKEALFIEYRKVVSPTIEQQKFINEQRYIKRKRIVDIDKEIRELTDNFYINYLDGRLDAVNKENKKIAVKVMKRRSFKNIHLYKRTANKHLLAQKGLNLFLLQQYKEIYQEKVKKLLLEQKELKKEYEIIEKEINEKLKQIKLEESKKEQLKQLRLEKLEFTGKLTHKQKNELNKKYHRISDTRAINSKLLTDAAENNIIKPFSVYLKIKSIYNNSIIYNYNPNKLARILKIHRKTTDKYVKKLINYGYAEINNGNLVFKSPKSILDDNGYGSPGDIKRNDIKIKRGFQRLVTIKKHYSLERIQDIIYLELVKMNEAQQVYNIVAKTLTNFGNRFSNEEIVKIARGARLEDKKSSSVLAEKSFLEPIVTARSLSKLFNLSPANSYGILKRLEKFHHLKTRLRYLYICDAGPTFNFKMFLKNNEGKYAIRKGKLYRLLGTEIQLKGYTYNRPLVRKYIPKKLISTKSINIIKGIDININNKNNIKVNNIVLAINKQVESNSPF